MGTDLHRYDPPAMERRTVSCPDTSNAAGFEHSRLWWVALLGLCVWQVWLTLSLFAPPHASGGGESGHLSHITVTGRLAWDRLTNDEPIVSGAHPLHLYFGDLGAQAFREHRTLCTYDPSFQAGYPKTPVFDAGSRPAELFLLAAGPGYRPAAYKIGLSICCLLVPLLLWLGARGFGLGLGSSCLATALGLLVAWGTPSRTALEAGDLDLLVAGIASLSYIGTLLAFDRVPCAANWFGLIALGCLGWFAHPMLWLLLQSLILVYYLSVGTKHPFAWHLGLAIAIAAPVATNSFWLLDWLRYWWIRLPLQLGTATLKHRTFHTMWACPLWGESSDRVLGISLLAMALPGVLVLNQTRHRVAARLVGLGTGGFFALTVVGLAWEPLGQLGAVKLLTPALWLAILPVVHLLSCLARHAVAWTGSCWRVALYGALVASVGAFCLRDELESLTPALIRAKPLALGLSHDRQAVVQLIQAQTTPAARILWEDLPSHAANSRWSVLLPILTGRAFIGGLAPDGCIEHAYCGLVDQALLGRPIALWSDAELDDYCRRYNVGWIVGWSAGVVQRLQAWRGQDAGIALVDEVPGFLFPVGARSFFLKGRGRVICAERGRLALADVVPDDEGVVLLAFHYQAGVQALPSRIQPEREPDPSDPIPFLRLRMPGPTPLITLTWDERK